MITKLYLIIMHLHYGNQEVVKFHMKKIVFHLKVWSTSSPPNPPAANPGVPKKLPNISFDTDVCKLFANLKL